MKLLREYIRELLNESAKGPDDLPGRIVVLVEEQDDYAIISYAKPIKKTGSAFQYGASKRPEGMIYIYKTSDDEDLGPCGGAYTISIARATSGWGPMLYDVAMEYATENGGGLTPDRSSVSGDAQNVWNYYFNSRGDVQSHQLDLTDREVQYYTDLNIQKLTPDIEEDDCLQKKALSTHEDKWDQSPLSKRYTKASTTMNALRAAGRLIEK
tara:strand:- start:24 stop:656 length:633 start_codon:yes stop_codon:yes gene_type:complete